MMLGHGRDGRLDQLMGKGTLHSRPRQPPEEEKERKNIGVIFF